MVELDIFTIESLHNFRSGGDGVYPGIGFVFELIWPVPSMPISELLCLDDHAGAHVGCLWLVVKVGNCGE